MTTANAVRRQILDSVCLNRTVGDLTLCLEKRKPFDIFAERPLLKNSRDRAQMFEPIQTLAATCVREYPVDRPPQLRFLARLVDEELAP